MANGRNNQLARRRNGGQLVRRDQTGPVAQLASLLFGPAGQVVRGAFQRRVNQDAKAPRSKTSFDRKYGPANPGKRVNNGPDSISPSMPTVGLPGAVVLGSSRAPVPVRMRLEGVQLVTNTAAGLCDNYIRVALDDGNGATTGTLAGPVTRLATHRPIYRRYRIRRLEAQWLPSVSDSTDGVVAVCYDQDIRVGQLTTVNNTLLRPAHFMTPLRMTGGRLVWVPRQKVDQEERYCVSATSGGTTRTVEELQYGTVAYVSNNSLASGATIGYIRFIVDVEFFDPI